nr:MAG TPA: hypothetical protein [Caudoviricetes sp.]
MVPRKKFGITFYCGRSIFCSWMERRERMSD